MLLFEIYTLLEDQWDRARDKFEKSIPPNIYRGEIMSKYDEMMGILKDKNDQVANILKDKGLDSNLKTPMYWSDYSKYHDFLNFFRSLRAYKSAKQVKSKGNEGESLYLGQTERYEFIVPLDSDASCFHGKHTAWCVSKPAHSYFYEYTHEHEQTLIFCLDRSGDGEHYAILYDSEDGELDEIYDVDDAIVSEEEFESAIGVGVDDIMDLALEKQGHIYDTTQRTKTEDVAYLIQLAMQSGERDLVLEHYLSNRNNVLQSFRYMLKFSDAMIDLSPASIKHVMDNIQEDDKETFADLVPKQYEDDENIIKTVSSWEIDMPTWMLKHLHPEAQLDEIAKNGYMLQHIKNPSDEMKKLAVSNAPLVMAFIPDASEELQKLAIDRHPTAALSGMQTAGVKASDEMYRYALDKAPIGIDYIDDPSEDLKRFAVSKSYGAIARIEDPSEELQILAIKQDYRALSMIKNPSENAILFAIKREPFIIRHVSNPSKEVEFAAINGNPESIKFINRPSEEAQIKAVKMDPSVMGFIRNPSHEVQNIAQAERNKRKQKSND